MFNRFDNDNDGEITLEEFRESLMEHYDYSDEEIETMFRGIDIDGTGLVHYIEFLAATIEAHGSIDEEVREQVLQKTLPIYLDKMDIPMQLSFSFSCSTSVWPKHLTAWTATTRGRLL